MSAVPFLTLVDPRTAVKGSRDPLGVQQIWSRLGRRIVSNLTTVTTSVPDFAVLLLGCHFCTALAVRSERPAIELFLKWEQIAGYARLGDGERFRGSDQASRRLRESSKVPLGAGQAQLLANQKTYGIWGLYTVAARSSGLIDDAGQLMPPGGSVAAALLAQLTPARVSKIEKLLLNADELDTRKEAELLKAIAATLRDAAKIQSESLREHLVYGRGIGPVADDSAFLRQRALARLVAAIEDDDWTLCAPVLLSLARTAQAAEGDLATHLRQICIAEALFAPAAALFDRALASDGITLDELARSVAAQWPSVNFGFDLQSLEALQPDLYTGPADRDGSGMRWLKIAEALLQRRYADAIAQLVRQNGVVMGARGGAAWIAIGQSGVLDVRFGGSEGGDLPAADDLPRYWRHAYFIDALRTIARQLRH